MRLPMRLAARLREQSTAISSPEIIAKTGWTTDDLARALDQRPPQRPRRPAHAADRRQRYSTADALSRTIARNFRALLQRAIDLAGGRTAHVIVVSIPYWSVTPFATRF